VRVGDERHELRVDRRDRVANSALPLALDLAVTSSAHVQMIFYLFERGNFCPQRVSSSRKPSRKKPNKLE
jgi:hypothetical protein